MCAYEWFLQENFQLTLIRRTTNFNSESSVIVIPSPPRLIQILTVVKFKIHV